MDILIGNGRSIVRNDFSSNWDNSPKLGKVEAGGDFLLNGSLGETNRRGVLDSSDRIKFSLLEFSTLNLNLHPQTIVEVVRFDSAGNAFVVGAIEYGASLQLQLAPGKYGLSLFVEGEQIDYSIAGQFL
jgi:hypothetical protein